MCFLAPDVGGRCLQRTQLCVAGDIKVKREGRGAEVFFFFFNICMDP